MTTGLTELMNMFLVWGFHWLDMTMAVTGLVTGPVQGLIPRNVLLYETEARWSRPP